MPAERGEYRGIYVVVVDGPDFQALTPMGQLAWFHMKLKLGPYGIDVIAGASAALAERSGMASGEASAALDELEQRGWLQRERALHWLVRGLEFEPSLGSSNGNHRAGLRKHLAGLPNLALKQRFRVRYEEWFVDEVPPSPTGNRTHANGIEMGSAGGGDAPPSREDDEEKQKEISSSSSSSETENESAAVPIDGTKYAQTCTVACNRGLRENPNLNDFRELVTSNQVVEAKAWLADRIPVELAAQAIYERAKAYTPSKSSRQPSGLRYFRELVREAWERQQGRAQERRSTPRPATTATKSSSVPTPLRRLV